MSWEFAIGVLSMFPEFSGVFGDHCVLHLSKTNPKGVVGNGCCGARVLTFLRTRSERKILSEMGPFSAGTPMPSECMYAPADPTVNSGHDFYWAFFCSACQVSAKESCKKGVVVTRSPLVSDASGFPFLKAQMRGLRGAPVGLVWAYLDVLNYALTALPVEGEALMYVTWIRGHAGANFNQGCSNIRRLKMPIVGEWCPRWSRCERRTGMPQFSSLMWPVAGTLSNRRPRSSPVAPVVGIFWRSALLKSMDVCDLGDFLLLASC
ncbi:hypothetical protein CRG98_018987 [Punica granatum]|uniref:Uncharacterized protein n=1 Tax=Punica granatum TaxID=22663 RepID=A0A2I0JWE7_PUNGR|nr:hypothetical protein CRG98_018987 [Punica granatum]